MRDETLERWVRQPPAPPNVQYLRDAERLAAWDRLGPREEVLDLASEINVTAGLDAESVTRVDFSPGASDRAREALARLSPGDDRPDGPPRVDAFETVDPEAPTLPFPDDAFDAAVCVGPYDWTFLDVERLTAEANRVVADDGVFVLTVPTPRSPYASRHADKYRYYEPAELRRLLSPDWLLVGADYLFQYPGTGHYLVNALPAPAQRPFVAAAEKLSGVLTAADAEGAASYVVAAVRPAPHERTLAGALDCLFRPTDRDGFWDAEAGRFVRALGERSDGGRFPIRREKWRYRPFALMGAMRWRASPLGTDRYDDQLRAALDDAAARATGPALERIPSYGLGPLTEALALAGDAFDESYRESARELYAFARDAFDFSHAEDALLPYGWARLAEADPDDERLRADLDAAVDAILARLGDDDVFAFDNHTTRRHQNQMYALWGLCRAAEVVGREDALSAAERVLDRTVDRRMREDGAFTWVDVGARRRAVGGVAKRLGLSAPFWDLLFPCHQTFFAVAVAHYVAAGGRRDYASEVRRAMAWIYGENEFDRDLVAESGLGVPVRYLSTDGRRELPEQAFVGAYEVGALLLAETALLAGPLAADGRSVESDGGVDGATLDSPSAPLAGGRP